MNRWVLAFAAVALVRSLFLGFVIPPYQSSDEPWHLDYARVVASGHLPVMGKTRLDHAIVVHDQRVTRSEGLTLYGMDDPPMSREAIQPPAGYVTPAIAYALTGRRPAAGLVMFRVIDALIGVAIVWAAFRFGRDAFPDRPYAGVVAAATAAMLPAMALVTSTANNDALAVLLSLVALHQAVTIARAGASRRQVVELAVLIGVAAWAKTTALALVVPAVVAVFLAPGERRPRARAVDAGLVAALAGAVIGPWLIRGLAVYGDLLARKQSAVFHIAPGRSIGGVGIFLFAHPSSPVAPRFWPRFARTGIGALGWSDRFLPAVVYGVALVALGAGAVAVTRWLRTDATSADRCVAGVIGSAMVALVAGALWFSYVYDYQPQGRYVLAGTVALLALVGASIDVRGAVTTIAVLSMLLGVTAVVAVQAFGWP